jgi:hypothetical protein
MSANAFTGKFMNKNLPQKKRNVKKYKPPFIIGWREIIGLPDFGILGMRAKSTPAPEPLRCMLKTKRFLNATAQCGSGFTFLLKANQDLTDLKRPLLTNA